MSFRDAISVRELKQKLADARPEDLEDLKLLLDGAAADVARAKSDLDIANRIYDAIAERIKELDNPGKP